jgi:large subunit ribosomal protein L19
VERVFPSLSPLVDKVEIVAQGKVRRSRLYYLRELSGKAARVRSRYLGGADEVTTTEQPAK